MKQRFASRIKTTPIPSSFDFLLQRKPSSQQSTQENHFASLPALVHEVLQSPGQPLDSDTRSSLEPRFGHDFSKVRVHTDTKAAASAESVNASAFTVGQHIAFGQNRFHPHTLEGRRLLAHELTHTIQQEPGCKPVASQSTEHFLEQDAERASTAFLRGNQSIKVAGSSALQLSLSPKDAESQSARQLRLRIASQMRVAAARITQALSGGLEWDLERITPQGNYLKLEQVPVMESMANRQRRITQLAKDLVRFTIVLESGPVPASWAKLPIAMPRGTFEGVVSGASEIVDFGCGPTWQTALQYFTRWQLSRGKNAAILFINIQLIPEQPNPKRNRAIPRVAVDTRGFGTGIYIVVPDPEKRPLEYHRLTGYNHYWNSPGEVIEVWHDSYGDYYIYRGRRHYLPEEV